MGGLLPGERDVGIVFQNLALYPDKTVYDNLAFPLRQKGRNVTSEEIDRRVRAAAETLHISALLDRKPGKLSGGERQRVALARALVTNPACVLADEPTGNLDRHTAHQVFDLMLELAQTMGTAFVIVTHDRELAGRCERVLRLSENGLQPDLL